MASAVFSRIFCVPVAAIQWTRTSPSHGSYTQSQSAASSLHSLASHYHHLSSQYLSSFYGNKSCTSICIEKKSFGSQSIKGLVHAKLVTFSGRKEVSISFQERSLPPREYLKETERIVKVTFPDSARIKYLGNSVWEARLQRITFFNFSATPYCDMRVVYDNEVLYIDSNKLILDVTGLPDQFRNMDLQLSLHGELCVFPRAASRKSSEEWDFGGWVDLGVGVNLPLPLSLIPERLLSGVGDQIVDRILQAMEGALLQGIINDYNNWCSISDGCSSSKQDALSEQHIRSAL